MDAARTLGIDHRWIWLWAEQGLVSYVEVESNEGTRRTYYAISDLTKLATEMRTGKREQVFRYPVRFERDPYPAAGQLAMVGG